MERSTYHVHLAVFEGPLDLLLHLIEQQELDITAVSLTQVTDQYLSYLRLVQQVRPDDLADFVRIAARLLLIKSRALLPRPPAKGVEQEEDEDVGEELVRRLREYRRFKWVAQMLQERERRGMRAYTRTTTPPPVPQPRLSPDDVSLAGLIASLRELLSAEDTDTTPGIHPFTITIDDKIARIVELLQAYQTLTFDLLLDDPTSREEIIVSLLAVLEMIRARRIAVRQEKLFGPIIIAPVGAGESVES